MGTFCTKALFLQDSFSKEAQQIKWCTNANRSLAVAMIALQQAQPYSRKDLWKTKPTTQANIEGGAPKMIMGWQRLIGFPKCYGVYASLDPKPI